MPETPHVTLKGKVQNIREATAPNSPEIANICIEGADRPYQEICVQNSLRDEKGGEVRLKKGSDVEVTFHTRKKEISPRVGDKKAA
jgi:hypothetical protein